MLGIVRVEPSADQLAAVDRPVVGIGTRGQARTDTVGMVGALALTPRVAT